ncbi:MAG: hypothetical protein JW909_05660 [Planctomycetes bacterium]|nr:hypothetical protein [Planctomycetota bacterium]
MRTWKILPVLVLASIVFPVRASARSRVDVDEVIKEQWVAYFDFPKRGLKRASKILVETMMPGIVADYTKQEDYWYYVKYSDYRGPKQRLAVTEFENKVPQQFHSMVPLADLESQLVTAVFATNRYVLVERKEIAKVIQEQDFGASGRVAKPSAAQIGQVLGAQFLVEAAITQYIPNAANFAAGGGGIGSKAAGGLAFNRKRAELTMNMRIIDATTSEIIASVQKTGWQASWGLGTGAVGGGASGVAGAGSTGGRALNIGRAAESCMAKMVYEVVGALKEKAWQGSIMLVKGTQVYVNAGETMGMQRGMVLRAMSKGEELVDPETGLVLGSETTEIGTITITDVKEKWSIASVTSGCQGLKKGDMVEFVR